MTVYLDVLSMTKFDCGQATGSTLFVEYVCTVAKSIDPHVLKKSTAFVITHPVFPSERLSRNTSKGKSYFCVGTRAPLLLEIFTYVAWKVEFLNLDFIYKLINGQLNDFQWVDLQLLTKVKQCC